MLSGGAVSGLRGARFPLWGTGGGFGRAVLEYTELLAGKRADNVYQASFSRSECVVQKKGDVKEDGWRLIGLGPNQYYPALTSSLAGLLLLY